MRSAWYSAVIVSLFMAGCGDSSGPDSGPPASLTVVSGDTAEGIAGTALGTPLSVRVSDAQGRAVGGATVSFSIKSGGGSLSATSAGTDGSGLASVAWTLGTAAGAARVEARVNGITAPAVFAVTTKDGPPSNLQRISPAPGTSAAGFEVIDSVAMRVSDGFGNGVPGASVSFAVVAGGGTVIPASATTDSAGVARAFWTLGAPGAQQLRAQAGTFQALVDAVATTCTQTQIAPGAVLTIGPADPRCVVLSGSASQYFVTVVNAAPTASSTNGFRFRGAGPGTGTVAGNVATAVTRSYELNASARAEVDAARRRIEGHDAIMRANERVLNTLGPRMPAVRTRLRAQASLVPVAPPSVGDILTLRIPVNFSNLCDISAAVTVGARVVFVGQHGVVLEDTLSPTRAQLDPLYQQVGQEFDTDMWALLNSNFGSPLAMDSLTDNNGRFYMLFSHIVNGLSANVAGFVASSDFFPPTAPDPNDACPASNLAEIFYARVPTVPSDPLEPFKAGTPESWYRSTRSVMMHEVKHIVSFAERFARNYLPTQSYNIADRWLEESSAMLAEELYARHVYGYGARQNVTYEQSVGCEVRPGGSPNPIYGNCGVGKPVSMFDHFILLYNYESNIEAFSPLGPATAADATFYGSGWNFLRWVIDTYGGAESSFLTDMTRETTRPGVQNVEARTGRTFADLVNDWAIALVMDDYPGFAPANPKHLIASWNVPDIFAGMSADFSERGFFTAAVPLSSHPATLGRFAIDVASVRGGSMAVFAVNGTQTNTQLFEVQGLAGTSFPADMRVNIIRVQ